MIQSAFNESTVSEPLGKSYRKYSDNYSIELSCEVRTVSLSGLEFIIISPFPEVVEASLQRGAQSLWQMPTTMPGIVICVGNSEISVHSSLYRYKDIFFSFSNNSVHLSTEMTPFIRTKVLNINRATSQQFILGNVNSSIETVIEGVYRIPPGTRFKWVKGKYKLAPSIAAHFRPRLSLQEVPEMLLSLIWRNLETINSSYGETKVMLSGGLDSMFLAECLKKKGLPFEAFHMRTPAVFGEGETEILSLQARALELDVRIVDACSEDTGKLSASNKRLVNPNDVVILPLQFWDERANPEFFDNRVSIDGHGGDAVFFSGGHARLPIEILLRGDTKGAIETLNSFCRSRGLTYWQWLGAFLDPRQKYVSIRSKATRRWLLEDYTEKVACHPMLKGCVGSRRAHVGDILETVCANQEFDETPKRQLFHPLMFPNIIQLALSVDEKSFFRGGFDRFCERFTAHTLSGASYPHRISKREASSLMFSALSQIAPELEKEIKDSRWLNAVGVDKDRLILSLNQNVSVIKSPDFPSIIRCMQLNKFLNTISLQDNV